MLEDTTMDAPPEDVPLSLGGMFRRVIATKNSRNAELFAATLKKLEAYCDPERTAFDDIGRMWLDGFGASMSGLGVNTRAIHMRNLRNVFNYAIDERVTANYPFRRYRIRTEETPKRVLPLETMRFYARAGGLRGMYGEYRDMFMLSFYLIGINIADLSKLTADSVKGGRLEYRRSKTGKLYSVRLEPEALDIIARYRGVRHLLSPFDRYASYKDYAQHLNRGMRSIGPFVTGADGSPKLLHNANAAMTPLEPKVTTYWARYSWATYAAELDIPKDTISEALGHEYGSGVTGVYIRFDRSKVDRANRAVIDYVLHGDR